jgi:hypothetical protein
MRIYWNESLMNVGALLYVHFLLYLILMAGMVCGFAFCGCVCKRCI